MTRQLLVDTVAPLMSAVDVRGEGDALRWDLLLGKAQAAAIADPAKPNPHRAEILEWVGRLPPHLNPVRAKADEMKALRSGAFWQSPSFADLDKLRVALRDVMALAEAPVLPPSVPTAVLDVREDEAEYQIHVRPSKIKDVDFVIYRKAVQAALEPLFESDPVLVKVRNGEAITQDELDRLNSLLHTRNPDVDLATLREFYPDTAIPLAHILRAIVGLDHEAVEAKFTAFAQSHALSSQQLRFLGMLKDHIRQFGSIAVAQLFDAPFNTLHAEGLGGVFPNQHQLDEVVTLVRGFGDPPLQGRRSGVPRPESIHRLR